MRAFYVQKEGVVMKGVQRKYLIFGIGIIVVVAIAIGVYFYCSMSSVYSRDFVEDYSSKYATDLTYLRKQTYTIGLEGITEAEEMDWYFRDNEFDFDFHVKTLKNRNGKHIICNYYEPYIEKFIESKGEEVKQIMIDIYSEIYDIEEYNIGYVHETGQLRISVDGEQKTGYSKEKSKELSKKVAIEICGCFEEFDSNFVERCKNVGWDVNLDTDWTDTDRNLSLMIEGFIFSIDNYYKEK